MLKTTLVPSIIDISTPSLDNYGLFMSLAFVGNVILLFLSSQILSRTKPAQDPKKKSSTPAQEKNKGKTREVEDFIADRDYTGAIAYLEVTSTSSSDIDCFDMFHV